MNYLFIDTEATDKYPDTAEVLSVSITDYAGTVLLDTLVRPVRETSWPQSMHIHHIKPADVLRPEVPTLAELNPLIADIIRGREVVIYNKVYDTTILQDAFALGPPAAVHCAMLAFSEHLDVRSWNDHHGNWRWHSLTTAAARVGHVWTGKAHTALADCFATADVWAWLTDPAARARLELAEAERREAQHVAWQVEHLVGQLEMKAQVAAEALNQEWERQHFPAMGVREFRAPTPVRAEPSADVFYQQLTGYDVRTWNRYGEHRLGLPRYDAVNSQRPKNLVLAREVHLLPRKKPRLPDALYIYGHHATDASKWLDAHDLFDLSKMKKGVDYVPIYPTPDYPEGHYSATALRTQFKLKPADIAKLRPAWLKSTKYLDYLLYQYPAKPSRRCPALKH